MEEHKDFEILISVLVFILVIEKLELQRTRVLFSLLLSQGRERPARVFSDYKKHRSHFDCCIMYNVSITASKPKISQRQRYNEYNVTVGGLLGILRLIKRPLMISKPTTVAL